MIDAEIKGIITTKYARVKQLIEDHIPHMKAIVEVLLEKETLDSAEFDVILARVNKDLGLSSDDGNKDDKDTGLPPESQSFLMVQDHSNHASRREAR